MYFKYVPRCIEHAMNSTYFGERLYSGGIHKRISCLCSLHAQYTRPGSVLYTYTSEVTSLWKQWIKPPMLYIEERMLQTVIDLLSSINRERSSQSSSKPITSTDRKWRTWPSIVLCGYCCRETSPRDCHCLYITQLLLASARSVVLSQSRALSWWRSDLWITSTSVTPSARIRFIHHHLAPVFVAGRYNWFSQAIEYIFLNDDTESFLFKELVIRVLKTWTRSVLIASSIVRYD